MTLSTQQHQRTGPYRTPAKSQRRAADPRRRARIVDEYPVGYLTELARPLAPLDEARGGHRRGSPVILSAMDTDHARELLAKERARIERALAELSPPDSEDVTDPYDAGDVAPEMVDEEIEDALGAGLREELQAIERAEARLADGTYGLSVESGEPIPDERLEVVPWAERTAAEQSRFEP